MLPMQQQEVPHLMIPVPLQKNIMKLMVKPVFESFLDLLDNNAFSELVTKQLQTNIDSIPQIFTKS